MAAETFRGCFKRHIRLRRLFSDGENVSQVCGDFFRIAQKACMPAGTFFGLRKRHACLRGLFSDCAKGMHACGNIFRKVKCGKRKTGTVSNFRFKRLLTVLVFFRLFVGGRSKSGLFGTLSVEH